MDCVTIYKVIQKRLKAPKCISNKTQESTAYLEMNTDHMEFKENETLVKHPDSEMTFQWQCTTIILAIHEKHGVLNHRQLNYLFNRLLYLT